MKVLPERERQVEGRAGRAEQGDIRNIKVAAEFIDAYDKSDGQLNQYFSAV